MIIGICTTKDGIFMSLYMDAVVVKGTRRIFGCTVNTKTQNEAKDEFAPLDLTPYSVRFRVLGSATADAKVLLEKIITQTTDEESIGIITAKKPFIMLRSDKDLIYQNSPRQPPTAPMHITPGVPRLRCPLF